MVVEELQIVSESVWLGLYGESWKGLICDEAFAHPAKFSRALIRKIYDHVIEEGWATKGSSVVDPFGGVALGAFDAMRLGLNWYGCELESRFVGLGGQNIALWNERFSRMPNWGTARLVQGDSRKLAHVLNTAECCVSSPPYSSGTVHGNHGFTAEGFKDPKRHGRTSQAYGEREMDQYGQSDGQLGAMKEGDHSLVVSSPPYSGIQVRSCDENHASDTRNKGRHGGKGFTDVGGGTFATEGQLSAMPEGELVITSPPYEGSEGSPSGGRLQRLSGGTMSSAAQHQLGLTAKYGESSGQMGHTTGETFWSASRLILEQLHQVIVPGGHAIFVVKAFVRDKQIVDFPGQWSQFCEAVGFRLLHHHRASLVEHSGTQRGFERDKQITVERKSFFRRLAEKKGSPRIDHESVLCFERLA